MKRLIFTLAICINVVAFSLASHSATWSFQNTDSRMIRLSLNGVSIDIQPLETVEMTDIHPGRQRIRFSYITNRGGYHSYFTNFFNGIIELKPATITEALIDTYFGFRIIRETAILPNNSSPYYGSAYTYGPQAMNDHDFRDLKNAVSRGTFESTKLSIARQGVRNNWLTTLQVKELLQAFNFESSRVDMAKFAYDRVVDRERYYLIYDAFYFSSSVRTLEAYIAGR